MPESILGVMALYLNNQGRLEERDYFKKLVLAGKKRGIKVFVFTPEDVDHAEIRIRAHFYNPKTAQWGRRWTGFPDVVFDRCRYQPTERFQQLKSFRAKYPELLFLNRPLANKWSIHKLFYKNVLLRPHMPVTHLFISRKNLEQVLKTSDIVYIKPINGTGGRGIMRVDRLNKNGMLLLQGRDQERRIIPQQKLTFEQLLRKLFAYNVRGHYLVQQGIDLTLDNGRVHDYRLLMQKDGTGMWQATGCAGRIGPTNSVTANLHGGGRAVTMIELFDFWFPEAERKLFIQEQIVRLGHLVVEQLEAHYGSLCEMALDLAIDQQGHIWLLEVNPKPAREVFAQINEKETYRTAIVRPIEYALFLLQQKKIAAAVGRVIGT